MAKQLFNEGKLKEAAAVLKTEELRDDQDNLLKKRAVSSGSRGS
jgi:hypothetical protein